MSKGERSVRDVERARLTDTGKRKKGKITKAFVDGLPFTEKGQKYYTDSELRGFGVKGGATMRALAGSGVDPHPALPTLLALALYRGDHWGGGRRRLAHRGSFPRRPNSRSVEPRPLQRPPPRGTAEQHMADAPIRGAWSKCCLC